MKQGIAKVMCKCTHDFQDKKYGAGVRIANTTAKQDGVNATVCCTVCKTPHQVPVSRIQ